MSMEILNDREVIHQGIAWMNVLKEAMEISKIRKHCFQVGWSLQNLNNWSEKMSPKLSKGFEMG